MSFDGLRFHEQACRWQDAAPCGNGTVGALVYGGLRHETVLLNHERLWDKHEKPTLDSVADCLPQVRSLLLSRQYEQARALFDDRLQKARKGKRTVDAYQPGPDLNIDMPIECDFFHYSRGVDSQTAETFVSWREKDATYRRGFFVSRDNGFGALHITCSKPGCLTADFSLVPHKLRRDFLRTSEQPGVDPEIPYQWNVTAKENEIRFHGEYPAGMRLQAGIRLWIRGGSLSSVDGRLRVADADEITALVYLIADDQPASEWPHSVCYNDLLQAHATLHAQLYNRTGFSLGSRHQSRDNEQLLSLAKDGHIPDELTERIFRFGKYLLLCAANTDGLPMNMRGIWNGDYAPPWESDYHNNEELDMMYWPLSPHGLFELAEPYFKYYEAMCGDYETNAKQIYGARGILIPTCQSTHGVAYLGRNGDAGHWAAWTCGAGWIASLFYSYWEYTGDDAFLRERTVPFLKKVAAFYEDFLVEDETGHMCFVPSLSAENVPNQPGRNMMTVNATMDIAIAREVLGHLISACAYLGLEEAGLDRWKRLLERLPPYRINSDGALAEWCWEDHPDQYEHRHLSHLYPAFPGHEIREDRTPTLYAAALRALEMRTGVGSDAQTGWSLAHIAAAYARLGKGEKFYGCLKAIVRSCMGKNLWIYHNDWRAQGLSAYWGLEIPVPVHPCANLGVTAAITEALIQSDNGYIAFLAAKPGAWRRGSLTNVRCQGRITASVWWNGPAIRVEVTAATSQQVSIRIPLRYIPQEKRSEWSKAAGKAAVCKVHLQRDVPYRLAYGQSAAEVGE